LSDEALEVALIELTEEREKKEEKESKQEEKESKQMAHEKEMKQLDIILKQLDVEAAKIKLQSDARSASASASAIAYLTAEVASKTKIAEWQFSYDRQLRECPAYADAPESTVQTEMIKWLTKFSLPLGLKCHDTHSSGVHGLNRPDAVFTLAAANLVTGAPAVAFMAEFKARSATAAELHEFPPHEVGQVLDKLSRLRAVRQTGALYAMLSNGHHYQLFMMAVARATSEAFHKSIVYTFGDVDGGDDVGGQVAGVNVFFHGGAQVTRAIQEDVCPRAPRLWRALRRVAVWHRRQESKCRRRGGAR
jgi:hypothetical protein